MQYLLDTHIFIWWMEQDKKLSKEIRVFLDDPEIPIFLSVASIWEITIKIGKKKLQLNTDVEKGVLASGFTMLPITLPHVLEVQTLPHHHKDPFDRILVAQAKSEGLVLITDDPSIRRYEVKTIA